MDIDTAKDAAFVEAMDAYDNFIDAQRRLHAALKDGYQGIARARFADPLGITAARYDMRMKASKGVGERGTVATLARGDVVDDAEEEEEKQQQEQGAEKLCPPLQWFGFLPSQALRATQTAFVHALEAALEAACAAQTCRDAASRFHGTPP